MAAIDVVPGVHVHAVVEPDQSKHELILRNWGNIECFQHLNDVPEVQPHVVVIASPTENHLDLLFQVLEKGPKFVIVEKPLAKDISIAEPILKKASDYRIPIIVNYNRRFDTRFQKLRSRLPFPPKSILVEYGKGVHNYASHFIDLILDWYGDVQSVQAIDGYDLSEVDPCPSFICRMRAGFDAIFIGHNDLEYDCLDMSIRGFDRRIILKAGGAEIIDEEMRKDAHYKGYCHLMTKTRDTGLVSGFSNLYEFIRDHDEMSPSGPACYSSTGLHNMKVIELVRRSSQMGNALVQMDNAEN